MIKWYVGTVVCGGCKSLLNIKSISESISCYLCNAMIDLSNCQVPNSSSTIVSDFVHFQPLLCGKKNRQDFIAILTNELEVKRVVNRRVLVSLKIYNL
jgi:LSD1 subclass zinc finger protein